MSEFQMPEAAIGDFVLYYPHLGSEANLGIVIRSGARALTLWVIAPGLGGVEKFSVHHKDDPGIQENAEWAKFGAWEHRPRDSRMSILMEKVSLLERKLDVLEPKKGKVGH